MTHTIQSLSLTTIENAKSLRKTEEKENIADESIMNGNIRELISLYDSLNNLCEKLCRLEYVITRKNIELSLTRKQEGIP